MAITTSNMGLRVWNLTTDAYDHAQLADNFYKLDDHDHSDQKGKQIPTGGIADGAVTGAKIAPGVIPSTLTLDSGAIITSKLADDAVTAAKLANNSVDSGAIIDGTIQTADLANSIITTGKLATDAVDNTILKDDATGAAGAVTEDHLRSGVVSANKLGASVAQFTGISTASSVRRGYTDIATSETWTGTPGTFALMPTADRVSNVVVPASGGLVYVLYRALWRLTGATNPASVALFAGTQQLVSVTADAAVTAVSQTLPASGGNWGPVVTDNAGFAGSSSATTNSTINNTFPQVWPGWEPLIVELPSGTYDISVRFTPNSAAGGTLDLKDRRLRVKVEGY